MRREPKRAASAAPGFVCSEVPLYYQLGTVLREQILSGAYAPGDQLPTEAELVSHYGVSRITVRQALKCLSDERLIRREAGRGTFVNEIPAAPAIELDSSLDDLVSMGRATSVKLLDLREVGATRGDADAFAIDPGSPVVQCTRLRFHHERPVSHVVTRLPKAIAERFERQDWEQGLILQSIEERLGIRASVADQSVRATLADACLARLLDTRIGAPLLSVDRVVRLDSGQVIEKVHADYRSDIYSLTVHLPRRRAAESEV